MSLKEYQDFVYSAILIDWTEQIKIMERLKDIMDKTDEVRIIGVNTDLTMSIKGETQLLGAPLIMCPGGRSSLHQ